MSTNFYALTDYIITISDIDKNIISSGVFSIGGAGQNGYEGSFLDGITIERSNAMFSTSGDETGSWVHNKSMNRVGTASISINQISDDVIKLSYICNALDRDSSNTYRRGLNIKVVPAYDPTRTIAECIDCFIEKIPNQQFQGQAGNQDWSFTCGRVYIYYDETI